MSKFAQAINRNSFPASQKNTNELVVKKTNSHVSKNRTKYVILQNFFGKMNELFIDKQKVYTFIIKFRTVKLSLVLPARRGVIGKRQKWI